MKKLIQFTLINLIVLGAVEAQYFSEESNIEQILINARTSTSLGYTFNNRQQIGMLCHKRSKKLLKKAKASRKYKEVCSFIPTREWGKVTLELKKGTEITNGECLVGAPSHRANYRLFMIFNTGLV